MAGKAAVAAVISILLIALVSVMGIVVVDSVNSATDPGDTNASGTALLDGTEYVSVYDGLASGQDPTVTNSLGNAADLNKSTSSVAADAGIDPLADDTWTATQVVWLDDTSRNQTVVAVGAPDVVVSYRTSNGGEWVAHYIGINETYDVAITATDVSNQTDLVVWQNGSTLTLSTASASDSVQLTGPHTLSHAPNQSATLDGQLDETRTYSVVLSGTQRSNWRADPVYPLDVAASDRGARLMYDRIGPLPQYFVGGDAATTDVTLVDGLDGETMQRADVLGNGDYRWDSERIAIKPLDGGNLDGHPVAYVDYTRSSMQSALTNQFGDAMELIPVLLIVSMAGVIVTLVSRLQ